MNNRIGRTIATGGALLLLLAGCGSDPAPAAAAPQTVTQVQTTKVTTTVPTTVKVTATKVETSKVTVTETAVNSSKNLACDKAIVQADAIIKEGNAVGKELALIVGDVLTAASKQDVDALNRATERLNTLTDRVNANNSKYADEFQPAATDCITG
jgi:hypothetical protein